MINVLNSRYEIPRRIKFSIEILIGIANEQFEASLKAVRNSAIYTITLEFDSWTSGAGMALLAITLTSLKGRSILLDLVDTTGVQHDSNYITYCVINSLDKNNVPHDKICGVASDQAANCRKARNLIISRMKTKPIFEFRCMAHFFNLIGALMSKVLKIKPIL